jgi:hypothetical protein
VGVDGEGRGYGRDRRKWWQGGVGGRKKGARYSIAIAGVLFWWLSVPPVGV